MTKLVRVYVGGAERNVPRMFAYVGGARRRVIRAFEYVGGARKQFFASVQLPAAGLSSSVTSTAAACTAYLEFRTDGWVWRRTGFGGGTDQQYYQWLPGGVTSDYQVRASGISGAGLTAGPTAFTTVSGPIAFTRTSVGFNNPQTVNFTIEVQSVASPGTIVASCPATMTAERTS